VDREARYAEALAATARAHAPYSGFRVGAVLLGAGGRAFVGANVEFASYGLTICAERTALVAAVTEGERAFSHLAVAAARDGEPVPAAPCGACRQALAEFGLDLPVLFRGPEGLVERRLGDLLPEAFTPDAL
jgi:cytidine deaminase